VWREEGQAERNGAVYIAEVSHFSFWNCDIPVASVYLQGNLVSGSGTPIGSSWRARIEYPDNPGVYTYGNISGDGSFGGIVPANEALTIQFAQNGCFDSPAFEEIIGPFSEDAVISITIPDGAAVAFTVEGSIVNCEGEAVSNAFITYDVTGQGSESEQGYVAADDNGDFGLIFSCFDPVSIDYSIISNEELIQTEETTEALDFSGSSNINLGNVALCDGIEVPTFFQYNEGEVSATFLSVSQFDSTGNCTNIYAQSFMGQFQEQAHFKFDAVSSTGSSAPCGSSFYIYHFLENENYYTASFSNMSFNITEYESNGIAISGEFFGDADVIIYEDVQSEEQVDSYTSTMSGSFSIEQ
jgi:hypothetical protein